jgi:hypothetical protein
MYTNFSKRRNIIGFDISAIYRFGGRVTSIDGLCLSRRGKSNGLLCSSIQVRRKVGSCFMFTKFFVFFGSAFRFKVVGFSYKKKKINFSKISYVRYTKNG